MIELRHLRAFHAVARHLSFHRASEELHIAQPALSRTIRALEEYTGARLFERTTRNVSLTRAGSAFRDASANVLDTLDHAVVLARQIEQGVAGEIRVGYNDFAINGLLPDVVQTFRTRFPRVRVTLEHLTSADMIGGVTAGWLDAACHAAPIATPGLDSMLLRTERLVALVNENNRFAGRQEISLSELAEEPFVMGRYEYWRLFHDLLNESFRLRGRQVSIVQDSLNSDGIIALVRVGIGVTIYVDCEWLHSVNGLVVLPLNDEIPTLETRLSWSPRAAGGGGLVDNFIACAGECIERTGTRFTPSGS